MKNAFKILILVSILLSADIQASKVDTVIIHSSSMNTDNKAVVIVPDGHNTDKPLPVVYLLHGYSGCYSDWISLSPSIAKLADQYDIIIACPEGHNSWYIDSPIDSSIRYETYVSKEIVEYMDKNYHTIKSPKGRAITGLSMGGHGALYLAIRHPEIFGAAGSMSGGVDIRPFPKSWEISKTLGSIEENKDNWDKNSVINVSEGLKPGLIAITIDCGTEDFFIDVNRSLHSKLLNNKIPHDYTERPGKHNWTYWTNSIKYHMLFFSDFFLSAEK